MAVNKSRGELAKNNADKTRPLEVHFIIFSLSNQIGDEGGGHPDVVSVSASLIRPHILAVIGGALR
jgi:hypothetical protein